MTDGDEVMRFCPFHKIQDYVFISSEMQSSDKGSLSRENKPISVAILISNQFYRKQLYFIVTSKVTCFKC